MLMIMVSEYIWGETCPDDCPVKKEIEANIMREKLKQL